MNQEEQPRHRRRDSPRTSFWAGILLLVLLGIAIFVASTLAASLIAVPGISTSEDWAFRAALLKSFCRGIT
jgi:hypothetical protein